MILLINAVPIATVLKEIYIKYRFKIDAKTNESIYVRFYALFKSIFNIYFSKTVAIGTALISNIIYNVNIR